jgi:hypothetical protein
LSFAMRNCWRGEIKHRMKFCSNIQNVWKRNNFWHVMQDKKAVEELEGNLQQTKCTFANWIKSWKNIAILSFSLARKIVKQVEPFTHGECISIFSDFTKTVGTANVQINVSLRGVRQTIVTLKKQ